MAITDYGYDGPLSDTEFAQMQQHSGALVPVVGGKGDFAVSINGAATRTCTVAAGTASAPGVLTVSDAAESVVFNVVSTSGQTRWDAVVLRRDWSAGTSTVVKVNGTAAANAPQVVPAGVDLILDAGQDQLLALVQIANGQPLPTQVVDRRVWGSKSFTIPSSSALPAPTAALYGMEAETPTGEQFRCLSDSGGSPAWVGGAKFTRQAVCTTAFTCPPTAADIPGMTITVPVVASTDTYLVTAAFDVRALTVNGGTFVGSLSANAVVRSETATLVAFSVGQRATVVQTWLVTGLAAGNRVLKCQARGTVAGVYQALNANSTLTVVQV